MSSWRSYALSGGINLFRLKLHSVLDSKFTISWERAQLQIHHQGEKEGHCLRAYGAKKEEIVPQTKQGVAIQTGYPAAFQQP